MSSEAGRAEQREEAMNPHRFSNRSEVREEINFSAKHDWMPAEILNLPIPMALQFALVVEIKSAILEAK
jgi:hypothetical protein